MNALLKRIHTHILASSLITDPQTIIIAVSGGADSVALLYILTKLYPDTRRIAVYVDHGLRPGEVEAEKLLVREHSKICNTDFETVSVNVQEERKKNNLSLEEAARTLRYRVLEEIRIKYKASCIAVGHTSDDQVEEVLLRLIRGTGSTGLSGMKSRHGYIIRPLLHETKENLLEFLTAENIPFSMDSSNYDKTILRNRVRIKLLPLLEQEYNPSIRQVLLRTAAILDDEDHLLTSLTEEVLPKLLVKSPGQIRLMLPTFIQQHVAVQRRIMDHISWALHSKPSFNKIQSLLELAINKTSREVHLSDGVRAVKDRDSILFYRPSAKAGYRGSGCITKTFSPISITTPGEFPVPELGYRLSIKKVPFTSDLLKIQNALLVDSDKIRFPLLLRHHKKGERFHPLRSPGTKKVSRFLTDKKISSLEKKNFPLLLAEDQPVALIGIQIDNAFQVTENTSHVFLLKWCKS